MGCLRSVCCSDSLRVVSPLSAPTRNSDIYERHTTMATTTHRPGGSKTPLLHAPAIAVSERTATLTHSALAAVSLVALAISNAILTNSYVSSGHPVSYAEGQLAFNGDTIKGYYAHMTNVGTLDTYVTTQIIDFAFILSVMAVGVFLASRLARAADIRSRLGRVAAASGTLLVIGAGFDVIENVISFIMLANPEDFPNALALPYSSAAAIKFAAMAVGIVLLLGSAVALAVSKVTQKVRP